MSNFKSTLLSYDRYLENGLFEKMVLPEEINKDLLINVIMKECGEMTPVWTNPEFMVDMIGVWSSKYIRTFEKWVQAYESEYDPIHNYDRYEEVEELTNDTGTSEISGTSSDTLSSTDSGNATSTNTRSAYDSATYQPHDRTEDATSDTSSSTGSSTVSNETSEEKDRTFSRDAHLYGNIGVTTTQQMLEAEYDIARWNIYENIKDLFMQEFCIMIY